MTLSDLDEIDKMRIQSLRDCEGLLWHLRFNHASKRYLEMAAKIIPEMRGVKFGNKISDCEACKLGKGKHKPCVEERHRSTKILDVVHSDVMSGPITPCAFSTLSLIHI